MLVDLQPNTFMQMLPKLNRVYSDNKLNGAIREYCNGTKKVIAVTELKNVCLNSVEASFKIITDAYEFAIPALYQLV